jgi:spore coat polysaccharide biosynthesis predicted glycosyltransferase SpsG
LLNNELKKETKIFSFFSIGSKKFGYGHYNRIENLISILSIKKRKFKHYSYGKNSRNKVKFIKKIENELSQKKKIILDISNDIFLDKSTIFKIQKILIKKKNSQIYVIDSPTKTSLSRVLKLNNIKTLIPFEITKNIKKKFSIVKKKKIGTEYFIYPHKNIKKKKKKYDIILSFGGSDKYKGTLYVLKLLKTLKVKKRIIVVIGKYFNNQYKNQILAIFNNYKFKIVSFSKNFNQILNESRLLITNSGLTKYEGMFHGLKVMVFSDTKQSQRIDKIFIQKTKQSHFSYLKVPNDDKIKIQKIFDKRLYFDSTNKINYKLNNKKLISFFEK